MDLLERGFRPRPRILFWVAEGLLEFGLPWRLHKCFAPSGCQGCSGFCWIPAEGARYAVTEVASIFSQAAYGVGEEPSALDQGHGCSPTYHISQQTSGHIKTLDDEQCRVAAGWVLLPEQKVDCRKFCRFASETFGKDISQPTASRYLAEFELSRKMMGSRVRYVSPAGL